MFKFNKNEERYTAHSDGNKIFKKEDEKEKEKAGTSSPEKKNIFNSVDASKNNQKINKEIIGDKINTKSEKEFDAKEIISRLREENEQIKKENVQNVWRSGGDTYLPRTSCEFSLLEPS